MKAINVINNCKVLLCNIYSFSEFIKKIDSFNQLEKDLKIFFPSKTIIIFFSQNNISYPNNSHIKSIIQSFILMETRLYNWVILKINKVAFTLSWWLFLIFLIGKGNNSTNQAMLLLLIVKLLGKKIWYKQY